MATTIDREKLKEQLQILAEQDLSAFKALITEVVESAKEELSRVQPATHSDEGKLRRTEVDAIIQQDFERFDDVFRALA